VNRPNLHITNTKEASRGHQRTPWGGPPRGTARWGRPASTLGWPAPGHRPSDPSFASYFNHLQGYILTPHEGRFDPRAMVPCSGLYKRGPRPPSRGEFIQSIIIITFKRKARVWGREVSLEWMSSQLPSYNKLSLLDSRETESEGGVRRRCWPVGASSTNCTSVGSSSTWACSWDGLGSGNQLLIQVRFMFILFFWFASLFWAL
jgi:hypothetical protein